MFALGHVATSSRLNLAMFYFNITTVFVLNYRQQFELYGYSVKFHISIITIASNQNNKYILWKSVTGMTLFGQVHFIVFYILYYYNSSSIKQHTYYLPHLKACHLDGRDIWLRPARKRPSQSICWNKRSSQICHRRKFSKRFRRFLPLLLQT